jgi:hypothetical protein
MTFIVYSNFIKVLGGDDVDLEVNFFWEDLEKIGKTIFQSRGWDEKDSTKDRYQTRGSKMNRVKIVLVVK